MPRRRYGTANHPVLPLGFRVFSGSRSLQHCDRFASAADSSHSSRFPSVAHGAHWQIRLAPPPPCSALAPPSPGSRRLGCGCGGYCGPHGGRAGDLRCRRVGSRLPRLPRGVPRSPPGRRHAEPLLGRAQLPVRRRVRGPGGRCRQAGLRRAGEYWLVCLRHYCHGKHQFSDVDLLQPGPQFLYVFSHCVCHSDVLEHTQLGHLRLRAVRRVPGGLVVGRGVPHPLWAHPDPQDTPTHLGGKQAAVIDPL